MTSSIMHSCDESDDSLRITSVEVEVITVPVSYFHEKLLVYWCICFRKGNILFNDAHFIYGYMASDIW